MRRRLLPFVAWAALASLAPAQEIQRGQIVRVDADKAIVVVKRDGKEIEALADAQTRLFEAAGATFADKLRTFTAGTEVQFVVRAEGGKNRLVGLRRFAEPGTRQPAPPKYDSSKLVPLDELGDREYKPGQRGGFYPDGKNVRPPAHDAAGKRLAAEVLPRGKDGSPDPNGVVVMLSVGMSNTSQASGGFQKALAAAEGIHPRFRFVNGAVGGQTAVITQSTETPQGQKYWSIVDQRIENAGFSREQVQVIWIKQADAGPNQGFPAYAKKLEEELANLVRIFPKRFPNAKLVYLSSRTYAGYATTGLNPEPYAYESAFSVKWLIGRQIAGDPSLTFDAKQGEVKAPWLSWGPYLWANGSTPRADGFRYDASDFAKDGTHHTDAGSAKIGRLMLAFFRADATSRPWFLAPAKRE